MLRHDTPVEYHPAFRLWVKREDLSCDGPRFSKTRGVLAHIAARPERVIGVLDTAHSQGGWAVARACRELGKEAHVWWPEYKARRGEPPPIQQREAAALGASLHAIPAGRSAVLYHRAKRELAGLGWTGDAASVYMMPNALKLPEMVSETAAEVRLTHGSNPRLFATVQTVLVSISSGTIAAGVLRGLVDLKWAGTLVLHQGYSRSRDAVEAYVRKMAEVDPDWIKIVFVDEGYAYADQAPAVAVPWPCNSFYDRKTVAWWINEGRELQGSALLWNIG